MPVVFDMPISRPLWELILERLPHRDEKTEWYALSEIAPLVGIQRQSLARHARDLWPNWEGHYRLNREQARQLIRRVCYAGRKIPPRREFE